MSKLLVFAVLSSLIGLNSYADVLPPKEATKICRAKALKSAHFISESSQPFIVSYIASSVAEISTPITFEFTTRASKSAGIDDALFTVQAYAYPDGSCLIGSVTNNIAGND